METLVTNDDELITEILSGRSAIYFVAEFNPARLGSEPPEKISLAGAVAAEHARYWEAQKSHPKKEEIPRPIAEIAKEARRLCEKGLATLVQRRTEDRDGRVVIEYLALSRRRPGVAAA